MQVSGVRLLANRLGTVHLRSMGLHHKRLWISSYTYREQRSGLECRLSPSRHRSQRKRPEPWHR